MCVRNPSADLLQRGLATDILDGAVYELSISERWLWRYVFGLRAYDGGGRFDLALLPLLGIGLARFAYRVGIGELWWKR
jgi:hypothetical protein